MHLMIGFVSSNFLNSILLSNFIKYFCLFIDTIINSEQHKVMDGVLFKILS